MTSKTTRYWLAWISCLIITARFALAGTLTAAYTDVTTNTASYNLTELGTSDWAHWGRDGVSAFNHKQTGGNQISDLIPVGDGPWPAFDANNQPARKMTWSDGSPTVSATNEQGFRYVTAVSSGYKFTAPASPTERKLYVILGGYATFGLLQISLSDGSAPTLFEQPSCQNRVTSFTWLYEITYSSDTPNQTVTVEYTKFDAMPGSGFSSDIWAAWLVGGEQPLAVYMDSPANGTTYNSPASPTLSAVAVGGTGGINRVEFMANGSLLGTDSSSPYSLVWDNAPAGQHNLTAVVIDGGGNMQTSAPVAITIWGSGGALSGSSAVSPDASSYDLTDLGTLDWIHWGRAANTNNLDRKATGNLIANFTVPGVFRAYSSSQLANWSDGSPTTSATNDSGTVSLEIDTGDAISFTVPADTTTRTLFTLVGVENTHSPVTGQMEAALSDFSAPTFLSTLSTTNKEWALYRVRYNAASSGQLLNVKWTKTIGSYSRAYLKAAWLVEGAPPIIALTSPTNGAQLSHPSTASITATASGDGASITQVEFFVDGISIGADTTAPYSANWNVSAGSHVILARATDSNGATSDSLPASVIVGNGLLTGTVTTNLPAIVSYDLTELGTSDWVNWGTDGNPASYDHKATGGGKISNITPIGTVGAVNNDVRRTSWSDGDPTVSRTNDIGYIHVTQTGDGFSFSVLADKQPRKLTILAGGYATTGQLVASLSDGSAPTCTLTRSGGSNYQNLYTLTYRAASDAQTLNVTLTKIAGPGGASVDLKAAWLVETVEPVPANLIGSVTTNLPAKLSYNLTELGTSDWINWGTAGSATAYDHKATGGGQISAITPIGTVGAVVNDVRRTSWSDGAPTVGMTNDVGYIYVTTIGHGFTFTAPAGPQKRKLTVLAGGYATTGQLVASLSDGSAPDYTVTRSGGSNYQNLYTLEYNSALPGQTLTVTLTKTLGPKSASVDLKAAWLELMTVPSTVQASLNGGQLTLNWEGAGRLEWAPSALGPWTAMDPQPASPYSETANQQSRFYRVVNP